MGNPRAALVLALVLALAGCSSSSMPAGRDAETAGSAKTPVPSGQGVEGSEPDPGRPDWVERENQRPGTKGWRIRSRATDDQITGFARQSSILPGQPVQLAVRSASGWQASALRLGYYGGAGARRVWSSARQQARKQPQPTIDERRMVSAAAWTDALRVDTTGWLPGSYLFVLTDAQGRGHYVPLTVRTAHNQGRLVLMSATSSYQAYNTWGGHSLYKGPSPSSPRALEVSFDRPYDQDGARIPLGYEHSIIHQAESLGLDLGYTTNLDLDRRAKELTGATALVSPGHDEYWSVPMRTNAEDLRDAGTNLAFFGANAVYWRVRFEGDGRSVIGYKSDAAADPVQGRENTNLWRHLDPESGLVGQLYECYPAHGAFRVEDPNSWVFAGTGAGRGSTYPGLVGVEIDRAYPFSPSSTRVVGHSPVQCADRGQTFSDMTIHTVGSGAGVVAVGTMDWRSAVASDRPAPSASPAVSVAFATRVTRNILTGLAAGPLAQTHPHKPNLDAIAPAASTGTGTGGAVTAQRQA